MLRGLTVASALDAHMATRSYVEGARPTQKDVSVFRALSEAPRSISAPHASRWYRHIASFSPSRLAALPGAFDSAVSSSAATAAVPTAVPTADEHRTSEDPATNAKVEALLAARGVWWEGSTHVAVRTSEEAAAVRGASLASGAKAVLLSVKPATDGAFVLVVLSAAAKMASKAVRKAGGFKSTRFAYDAEVLSLTGCVPGAVPPFGSVWGLRTFMDESLTAQGSEINFNAGLRTRSVRMRVADYVAVEAPTVCSVCG